MLIISVPEHHSAVEDRGNKKVYPQRNLSVLEKGEDRHTFESGRKSCHITSLSTFQPSFLFTSKEMERRVYKFKCVPLTNFHQRKHLFVSFHISILFDLCLTKIL